MLNSNMPFPIHLIVVDVTMPDGAKPVLAGNQHAMQTSHTA